ncbi:MAG: type secretion system protein VasG, partial [Paraburkholderia sp.]|nr:type secretion system protein VasG [Paraburkholderia sp.]
PAHEQRRRRPHGEPVRRCVARARRRGLRDALTPELLKVFPAAFLGRVTLVPYRPLADMSLASIVRLHLDRVVTRMADAHVIVLTYDEAVIDYIVARCLVQETGARVLIGFIEQHLLPKLSALWLDAFSSNETLAGIRIGVSDPVGPPCTALVVRPVRMTGTTDPARLLSIGQLQ